MVSGLPCRESGTPHDSREQRKYEQNHEDEEEQLRDACGGHRNSCKPEDRSDQSDNEETQCVTQHVSSFWIWCGPGYSFTLLKNRSWRRSREGPRRPSKPGIPGPAAEEPCVFLPWLREGGLRPGPSSAWCK